MLAVSCAFWHSKALGVTYHWGATTGVMQQPTSHYYHLTYGTYLEAASDKKGFLFRLRYAERPKFSTTDFEDQEQAMFTTLGTQVLKSKYGALYGYFGGGNIKGSIRSKESNTTRTYELSGLTTEISWAVHFKHFEVALEHQTFVGLASQHEVEAYVGWPFNFYRLSIGTNI